MDQSIGVNPGSAQAAMGIDLGDAHQSLALYLDNRP